MVFGYITAANEFFEKLAFTPGALQGCPRSGFVFNVSSALILRAIYITAVSGPSTTRACADDIGMAVRRITQLLKVGRVFRAVKLVSALALKPKKRKIVIMKKVSEASSGEIRTWLAQNLPEWTDLVICEVGKYLGFLVGPGASSDQWAPVEDKFHLGASAIAGAGAVVSLARRMYSVRAVSVLSYLSQLLPIRPQLLRREKAASRRLPEVRNILGTPWPRGWALQPYCFFLLQARLGFKEDAYLFKDPGEVVRLCALPPKHPDLFQYQKLLYMNILKKVSVDERAELLARRTPRALGAPLLLADWQLAAVCMSRLPPHIAWSCIRSLLDSW